MNNVLYALINLQKLDSEILLLEKDTKRIPEEIAKGLNALQEKENDLNEEKSLTSELQKKKRSNERILDVKESEIDKLSGQLFDVKTNKEYSTLQSEINNRKKEKESLEDSILENMGEIETFEKDLKVKEKTLIIEKNELEKEKLLKEKEIIQIQKKIEDEKIQRQEFLKNIPKDILVQYERMLQSEGGLAVAPIDFNKEACLGCYMNLPPQFINEIKLNNKLITCDKCGRFLYWDEEND